MKDCKIYTNGKSEEIQKKLLELGCHYRDKKQKISPAFPFLYVNSNLILAGSHMNLFINSSLPEISAEAILKIKPHKPFDKVLICGGVGDIWRADIFSHFDSLLAYPFVCVGSTCKYCISYEGNEELLGTEYRG